MEFPDRLLLAVMAAHHHTAAAGAMEVQLQERLLALMVPLAELMVVGTEVDALLFPARPRCQQVRVLRVWL
jgi:hypothetical protein